MRYVIATLFALLLSVSVGCSDDTDVDYEPLPGPIILKPAFIISESFAPEYDPYVLIETQYVWWGCCSEIVISGGSPSEHGPVSVRVMGVKVQTYFDSMAPAEAWLQLPRIPFDYDLYIAYEEFTDNYQVHVDESLLVITPVERHFTIIHDTLARMP